MVPPRTAKVPGPSSSPVFAYPRRSSARATSSNSCTPPARAPGMSNSSQPATRESGSHAPDATGGSRRRSARALATTTTGRPSASAQAASMRHATCAASAFFGEAKNAFLAHVRRHVARERHGRVLARHHDERGLGPVRETGGHQERPRRRGHAQRRVLARVELAPERVQAARLLQRERKRIYEHVPPPFLAPYARSLRLQAAGRCAQRSSGDIIEHGRHPA